MNKELLEKIGEVVPSNVLGMMADLALKLQSGNITPDQFGKFLQKKDPFTESNQSEIISGRTHSPRYSEGFVPSVRRRDDGSGSYWCDS